MRRRDFITLVGGSAAWPLAARAQKPKLPRIGVLITANPEPFWTEFQAGLREHGYVEGQNIVFEFRSADGELNRLRELADELVRLRVDIIVAWRTPAVTAARHATTEIPIVMASAGDPLGTGLISSLARPGGNITGLSSTAPERYLKTVEFIREVLPSTQRISILANPSDPFSKSFVEAIEDAGRTLGIAIQTIRIREAEEFDAAFAAMVNGRADAVIMQASLPRKPALDLALRHHLPLVGGDPSLTREGALMSYSPNDNEMYRRVAFYIDQILKGAKPGDLPVEQPTRYEIVINRKTATALGLSIPPGVLAIADEVID